MTHFEPFRVKNVSDGASQFVICHQALNTLGNTKWRVNKKILDIVDRIWASGGRLADLVDREDVRHNIRTKN